MNMRTTFTAAELAKLRDSYRNIERVSPDRLDQFRAIFADCHDAALLQLCTAGVRFVSALARNEAMRRKLA